MSGQSCQKASFFGTHARHALMIGLVVWAGVAHANKPKNIEESEMQLIPPYCPHTMGFKYGDAYSRTSPMAKHWVGRMGESFWHMHHYCWARINLNRAQKAGTPQQERKGLLEQVRNDYNYVIERAPGDFIMLPEVYTRLGEVELLLGNPNKAKAAFDRARAQKPDYWPAYSYWAEFLLKKGQRPEALKTTAIGLSYAPDSKVLRELFRVLGGKPSDIPPRPAEKTTEPPAVTENETQRDAAAETPNAPLAVEKPVPEENAPPQPQ